MKKLMKLMALVLVLVLAIGVMVACNDTTTTPPDDTPGNTDDPGTTPPTDDDPPADPGNGEDTVDTGKKYTVIFKYVDPQGNELKDKDGYSDKSHKNIKFNGTARNTNLDDVQAFDEYVIIGWNADLEAAKAGTVDPKATAAVKSNRTLYSVVRAKVNYEITFLDASGKEFQKIEIKEGTGLTDAIPRPVEMGKYFKGWEKVEDTADSDPDCIRDACSFKAVMGATDGTIGKVAAGTIALDGKKEAAYMTSGAYLPLNMKRQADHSYDVQTQNPSTGKMGDRAVPVTKANTYIVWDGDYIYLLIEVFDKTLVGRAESYVKGGVDAWCNDAIELWYTFEQEAALTTNETRVGCDAMGYSKYALGRDKGIGGGRSTHYEEIQVKVRNYLLGDTGADLSTKNNLGETLPSYIMEFKIPAKTEGTADFEQYPDLSGAELDAFTQTGLIPGGDAESNDMSNYAFTDGKKLVAGDFVRFNLQLNDLMFTQQQLSGATGEFLDAPPEAKLLEDIPDYKPENFKTQLFAIDATGKITGAASTRGMFSASSSTQREVNAYIMFSLSNSEQCATKIWSLGAGANRAVIFYDKDGKVYTRPANADE